MSFDLTKETIKTSPFFSISTLLQVVVGSCILTLTAYVSLPLPFSLVPLTLQTLGIAILAITLGSKKGSLAVICYLVQATMGLPVLAGGNINPLWMIGPRVGYLIGFVVACWLIGKLLERETHPSWIKNFCYIACGEACILILGVSFLAVYIGPMNAITTGLIPFLPGALIKTATAASAIKPICWIKEGLRALL